jgi:Ca2+-binding RTX toxin-like protein
MAKFIKVRGEMTAGTSQPDGGEFISGRHLLNFSNGQSGVQGEIRGGAAATSGAFQSPHGTPRDVSVYNDADKPSFAFAQTPATDIVSLTLAHDRGDAPTSRHIVSQVVDPRSLLNALECGVHEGEKTFNGYERHAGDTGFSAGSDLASINMADEGTLNVTVGGSVSGLIDFTGDVDTITVSLVAGQTYSFSLTGTGGTPVTDTFLSIFSPSAALLVEDDDGGNGTFSLITITAATTGTYTLTAESFANPGDPGLGEWTLSVHQQGVDEAPSAPPSAVPITVGSNYGFINPAGTDEDVYSITLTAGFIYNFELAGGADYNTDYLAVPGGELDTIIRIYDSAGTLLFTNDDVDFPDDISSAIGFIPETSGTYYVEVDAYSGQSGGYVLDVTETDLSTLDPLDAIDWGGPLNAVDNSDTLLIYFATAGETYDGVEDLGGWTPYLQQQALAAFQTYSQFADLTFAITTDQSEADFTLVTTESDEFLAYFNPPGTPGAGIGVFAINGTGWDPTGTEGSMEPGGYGWITFIHEFGHGLGMAHPHDNGGGSEIIPGVTGPFGSYGIFDLNQGVYTTMSYNDGWQLHPDVDSNGFPVPDTLDYGYQGTPMAFDIALMQIKYGAVAHNTGDNVYTLGTANLAGTFYQCIWDTGGTDTVSYAGSADATIDLTAATLDYSATGAGVLSWVDGIFGGYTIASGVVIENATGGSGNDVLVGNSAVNTLTGNNGNDNFVGGLGNDTLVGGLGIDTAVFLGNQADYTITAIVGGWTIQDNNTANGDEGTDTFLDGELVQFADAIVTLDSTPGNQAPTLTGLVASLTFNENVVNATPQLIDGDVTFADSDGNFNGGSITVSGGLAEDVIAVRNEGTAPGQVGVSGANITFGGLVVGTFAGGTSGTTLTITLNANATSLAVDQILENLTYANTSNTPTEDRTLTINVTDSDGADLNSVVVTPGPFVEQTGGADPLAGLPAFGDGPSLAFVDVNNDGDNDIVVGDQDGSLRYFENNGAGYTEVTGAGNPFGGFVAETQGGATGSLYSSPATVDIDGDGDLDLVVANNYGYFGTVRNNGNGTWTQLTGAANPLDGIVDVYFADPTGIDYDGDGDIDIVSGSSYGDTYAIRNDGGGNFTFVSGGGRPFAGVTFDVGGFSSITSGDVDGDGDLDLVVGEADGILNVFLNNGGGTFVAATPAQNPWSGIDFGSYSLPAFGDIDGDGDLDLVVSDNTGGDTRVWLNTSTSTGASAPTIDITVNAQNDAPSGADHDVTMQENGTYTLQVTDFGYSDLENDFFTAVKITTLPDRGTLLLNGVPVVAGQLVGVAAIGSGLLTFVPEPGEASSLVDYASFTFQVRDDGGTANGGANLDPTPNVITFEVTPLNTPPVLSDVTSPVTFAENLVNATPQLLDTNVTFVDVEDNLNGGTLTVSGVLAEDRLAIQNEGTGVGQIGVSGANVTYGGVVIGTFAGGTGTDLTVTLNAAATSVAVEALIEHLTYANVSNTPTETRTLLFQATDATGESIIVPTGFTEQTGDDNPFDGLFADSNGSIPTFVDADGDGDLDLVVGAQDGNLQTFANDGAGNFTELTGAANPFDGFNVGGTYSAPAAIDLDGDGDLDLVVGSNYGDLVVLENDGSGGWSAGGILADVSVYAFSTPTVVDLDGDGLEDLVLGSLTGFLYGFHNNGDGTFTELTGADDPFLSVVVDFFSAPGFVDLDGDGDLDAVVGDYYGGITTFTNELGTFIPGANNPFPSNFSSIPAFTFIDLDNDGDLDGVAGSFDGDIRFFESETPAGIPLVVNITPQGDNVTLYDETNTLVATYETIQEAVDAASNGYRITLASGTYTEQVVIDGLDDLTIEAEPGADVTIEAPQGLVVTCTHAATHMGGVDVYAVVTAIDSTNLTINGVTIDGASAGGSVPSTNADFAGVFFRNSSGELVDVDITGVHYDYDSGTTPDGFPNLIGAQAGTGVVVDNDTLLSFTMTGGSIEDFQKNAGRFWEADLDISDVTVTGSGAQGASGGPAQNGFVVESGTGSISGNTLTAIGYAGPVFTYSVVIYVRGADDLDVTGNTIVGTNGATLDARVLGIAYYDDNAANNGGTITGNIISFVDTGVDAEGDLGGTAIVINGNIVTNVDFTDSIFPAGVYFEPTSSITLNFSVEGSGVTDYLTGAAGNDTFSGLGGNDYIDGGAGTDLMSGGTGDDSYLVDNAGDQIVELTGEGADLVASSSSYALNAGAEVEILSTTDSGGIAAIALTGSAFGQTIIGNAGGNFLNGGGGADILQGLAGNDVYIVDTDDLVLEAVSGGNDLVASSASYALNAGAEVEILSTINSGNNVAIALTGNEFGQTIIGNAGDNFLNGGGGADILDGGAGDDVIIVDTDDQVVEAVGGGNDLVASSASYALAAGAEVETLSTINSGNNVAIALTGNEFGQTIIGNAGDNFLNGGGGADILDGGAGNDVIIVDADDQVLEAFGEGTDLVASSTSYALNAGAQVETLSTINSGNNVAIALTGNELGQTIIGNAGDNFLNGGGGADTLQGLAGNDVYIVDADDLVLEAASGGNDLVASTTSYALNAGAEVETLSTTYSGGVGALNLSGNAFGQTIVGNAGANVLDGGMGADTLQGLGGADTFAFTTALGGGNVDAILDFAGGSDKIALDDAVFTGLGLGALSANAFVTGTAAGDADDRIIYNSATGQLFFDADGNGAGAAVLFATLQGNPVLAASDFVVI